MVVHADLDHPGVERHRTRGRSNRAGAGERPPPNRAALCFAALHRLGCFSSKLIPDVLCCSCGQGSHKDSASDGGCALTALPPHDTKQCVCGQAVFEHPGHLEQGGGMVAEGSLVEAAEEMHLKAGDGALSA